MTLVRLYGRELTQSSQSVVTAGFKAAFEEAGILAGVYGVDTQHLAAEEDLELSSGVQAPHAVYTGPLDRLEEMFTWGKHEHYWVMLAPNSDRLPGSLVERLKKYQEDFGERFHLMTPSSWASDNVAKLFHRTPVLTVPHGVSPEYRPHPEISDDTRKRLERGEFRVVHFSTSAQARKGTFELIQAWMSLRAYPDERFDQALLLCVLDYPAKIALRERLADEGISIDSSVVMESRADLKPEHMARLLASASLVCQPSRGEAFGLVPLQALCVGAPVAATICTGHSEYLSRSTDGLCPIDTGPLAPLDDLPGSVAPRLNPEDIRSALSLVRNSAFHELQTEALSIAAERGKKWSWSNQLSFLVQEIRRLS